MSFDMTRREALGVLGAAAGTLLAGPLPAMASDNKDEDSSSDAAKGSETGALYAACLVRTPIGDSSMLTVRG